MRNVWCRFRRIRCRTKSKYRCDGTTRYVMVAWHEYNGDDSTWKWSTTYSSPQSKCLGHQTLKSCWKASKYYNFFSICHRIRWTSTFSIDIAFTFGFREFFFFHLSVQFDTELLKMSYFHHRNEYFFSKKAIPTLFDSSLIPLHVLSSIAFTLSHCN